MRWSSRCDGSDASRLRARAIVTWLPVAAALVLVRAAPRPQDITVGAVLLLTLPLLLLAAGAVYAIRFPSRSLQDRLAGTWIVPR